MIKINASKAYKALSVPRKVVSKKNPPLEGAYHEIRLRHRSGKELIYVSKSAYGQFNEETKWCCYCSCVVERIENGHKKFLSTGQFYSYQNYPYRNYCCPDCKPKCEKAHSIQKQIQLLKIELDKIDGLI